MRRLRTPLQIVAVAAAAISLAGAARAQRVHVEAALDHGILRADTPARVFLRVGLTGARPGPDARRAAMNVAIVIDRSKSMAGDKIAQAKRAARAAIDHLGPDDIVSVVAYDSTVEVLVPATKARDRAAIRRGIERLRAGGMTALFGGTSKGAAEVRKFLSRDRVNRVILLSDGQANVGPSTPGDLARLGEQLARDGIGVTTVGLGLAFNEDLMVALAERSGGNHYFVEHARELGPLFDRGFGGLSSVVAKDAELSVTFAEGVRPVRTLGGDAELAGDGARWSLSQLYAGQTNELVIELAIAPLPVGRHAIADVRLGYRDTSSHALDRVRTAVTAELSEDAEAAAASARREVQIAVAAGLANLDGRRALTLRDQGHNEQARRLLLDAATSLDEQAARWGSPKLHQLARATRADAAQLDAGRWNRTRKEMQQRINNRFDFDEVNF